MSENKVTIVGEMCFMTLLTFIFVILRLFKVISWSWWWVVSPLLIGWGTALMTILSFMFVLQIKYGRLSNRAAKHEDKTGK